MVLNLDFFANFANLSFFSLLWYIITHGGWIIVVWGGIKISQLVWLKRVRHHFEHQRSFLLLAINIPKLNEQSPKAVEQIFAQVHGALSGADFYEKWWLGKTQERFSFEIVSSGGYIRFFVWTNTAFRDLIEAAFFSQYPDAEIIEVEDYTHHFPHKFPNPEWDMWGTEFILTKHEAYPLRTYPEFEHTMSQELKDPLAGMLESMSKLGPDEHIWLQYVVQPTGDGWKEHAQHIVDEMIGAHREHAPPFITTLLGYPVKLFEFLLSFIFPPGEGGGEHGGGDEAPNKVQYLTPGERAVLEGVQLKMAKIGYFTKMRFVYIAKKEVFNKARGVVPILGAMRQFSTQHMNGLSPSGKVTTAAKYYFVKERIASKQRKLMHAFHLREDEAGEGEGKVLNIEELATLYHFPVATVKAPLISKALTKQAEPPFALPVSERYAGSRISRESTGVKHAPFRTPAQEPAHEQDGVPGDLPVA
ncbi:hypothetical protein HZA86_05180 [Candidatus Uhrbacteria bacterium]|nr:hypothetical protein [Candidatus Uhrbacteria bacterium]